MMTYNPEPGAPAGDAIKLLQSWTAKPARSQQPPTLAG